MGSTQREERVPAPPPYTIDEPVDLQRGTTHYAPPPGPPPPVTAHDQFDAHFQPPPLSQAPPVYEPFSFADEFAADQRRRRWAEGLSSVQPQSAPRWHGPPVYDVYYDAGQSAVSVHISLPSTLPPCACGPDFVCSCGRRRPAVWHASKSGLPAKRKVTLLRLSPCSGTSAKAMVASRGALFASGSLSVHDDRDKKVTEVVPSSRGRSFTFVNGQKLTWARLHNRLELLTEADQPMAILHTSSVPARLELTAFAWARMPSDELECDFPRCTLRPLFGFVFRCHDCTSAGYDSFDICESHLVDECDRHDPTHRFERLPRPFGEYDDHVRETALLRMHDMELQRRSQELVVMTLAITLSEKAIG